MLPPLEENTKRNPYRLRHLVNKL